MDYAYSFAAVGDTQMLNFWGQDSDMNTMYKWIVDNVEEQKIQHVFGLGDITETWGKDTPEEEYEWQRAKDAIYQMNGKVSYSLVRGNHDESGFMNEYLNEDIYKSQFGGFYDDGTINTSWKTLKVGNVDFLFIGLDFGASDDELAWAGSIVEAHPNHKVIVTTHGYLEQEGNRMGADYPHSPADGSDFDNDANYNHGEGIWEKFVSKYENIFLVMSGHINDEDVVYSQDYGVHGNVVTQILIDFQDVDKQLVQAKGQAAAGIVTMLYMNEDCSQVEIAAYSTIRDKFYKKYNHFTIDLDGECDGNHTLEYKHNDYKHWQECACGYVTESVYHNYENHTATTHGTKEGVCACGLTKEVSNTTNAVALELQSLLERYYNNGSYIKDTTIYIDKAKAGEELASYFHADVDILERTTYYDGSKLWMSTGSDYSGYGTSTDGHLTTFRVSLDGVFSEENVLSNLPGMEEYYCTLLDLILGQHTSAHTGNKSLNLNNGWTYENGVYTNTNLDVLDAFRLFTAPGWLGKNAITQNFVTYTKATIDLSSGALVLKLWVSAENKGLFADGYTNVDSEGNYLFSEAVISEYYWKGNESSSLHGSGTEANPYLITNTADLMHFRANASLYAGKYVKLVTDIDLKGQNFMIESFAGTFDGAGHKISGLAIDNVGANTGLFRTLEAGGVIKNLSVDGTVIGQTTIGAIVGTSYGSVENCKNYATVTGNGQRGGIVGLSKGNITNCHNYGEILILATGWNVGGIVGECNGKITGCTNNAVVYGTNTHVGGIVGSTTGSITDCVNNGDVINQGQGTDKGAWGLGGIAGYGSGVISGCVNNGDVSVTTKNNSGQVGGIVGKAYNTISNCTNNGAVTAAFDSVGGIVGDGYATTKVESCNNYGTVSGKNYVGGIVGKLQDGYVKTSTNYAEINGTAGAVAGVVGYTVAGYVENCVNEAEATISGGSWSVAGVVGHSAGNVISCKNYAAVTGTGGGVAGVVGELVKDKNVKAENCENYGDVAGKQYTGGIVGYQRNNSVVNCVNEGAVAATNTASDSTGGIGGIAGIIEGGSVKGSTNKGTITGYSKIGGIVGYLASGTVSNNTNNGLIKGSTAIGGIAGESKGVVDNCENYGQINENNGWTIGGIVGNAVGEIKNSKNYGLVKGIGTAIGGIAGYASAVITGCVNQGTVTGSQMSVGGIAGKTVANVTNCRNIGSVSASRDADAWSGAVGGIAGTAQTGKIENCVNEGAIAYSATKSGVVFNDKNGGVGGIVGDSTSTITNCTNNGAVTTKNDKAGGVVGSTTAAITKCTNNGNITAGAITGGIAGNLGAAISECINYGVITGTNTTGGIAGKVWVAATAPTTATKVYNYGTLKVSSWFCGGLFGTIDNVTVSESANYGEITSTGDALGGLIGASFEGGKLVNCNNYGNVTAKTGIAGIANTCRGGSITNCHNYGVLKGTNATPTIADVCITNSGTITGSEKTAAAVWDGTTVSTSLQGIGTAADPYLISSGADLAYIASVVNAHTEFTVNDNTSYTMYSVFKGKYFKLTNDIDLGGHSIVIGYYNAWNDYAAFAGTLEGSNYSIKGLNISGTKTALGLFAAVGSAGTIQNVSIYGSLTTTADTSGALVGWLAGKLVNCVNYATVTGKQYTGGLIGNAESKTSSAVNCVNYGVINGTKTVGGIAGCGKSTFTNCVNYGTVKATSDNAGGIVGGGTNQDLVSVYSGCVNYGSVTGVTSVAGIVGLTYHSLTTSKNYGAINGSYNTAGVAGTINANVENSQNFGTISCTNTHGAGVVGSVTAGNVTDCTNYGDIIKFTWGAGGVVGNVGTTASTVSGCVNYGTVKGGSGQAGGIVGKAKGTVTNSTNYGTINVSNDTNGGIVGQGYATTNVSNCVNKGNITGKNNIGGLVGLLSDGSVTNCANYGKATSTTTNTKVSNLVANVTAGTVTGCVDYTSK